MVIESGICSRRTSCAPTPSDRTLSDPSPSPAACQAPSTPRTRTPTRRAVSTANGVPSAALSSSLSPENPWPVIASKKGSRTNEAGRYAAQVILSNWMLSTGLRVVAVGGAGTRRALFEHGQRAARGSARAATGAGTGIGADLRPRSPPLALRWRSTTLTRARPPRKSWATIRSAGGEALCEVLRRGVLAGRSRAAGKIICIFSVHEKTPWPGTRTMGRPREAFQY